MNQLATSEAPPTDFVAFLAQRGGLSPEDAQHRLEHWFGEYHASSCKAPGCKKAPGASVEQPARPSAA
jgi:hypothetical protein